MLKAARLARTVALLALALFAACNSDPQSGVAVLSVTATPRQIDGRGRASLLSVEARDVKGQPGTGVVTLTASAGTFSDGTTQTTLTLANGIAGIGYMCNASTDTSCANRIRIDATWGQLNYSLILDVANQSSDGGTSPDAGEINIGYLTLSASKSPIFYNVGDFSNITAQLSADAGVITGQTIGFSANLGGFTLPDGGIGTTVNSTTGADGKAVAQFRDNGAPGTATIVATHVPSSSIASMPLPIVNIQAISWVSTTCGGTNCTIMGIRGSGFNEQATVTFKVVDSSNLPAPGVNVSFSMTNPPLGTTVTPAGVTNSAGLVSTNISVGQVIGVFTVRAVVIPNQVQINSPPIGLRGAKASNHGMVLDCRTHNLAAYVSPQPPLDLPSTCTITLVDRFGNAVGTGAAVNFKSEAGIVPSTINTIAFNPSSPDPNEGTATFTFRSGGPFDGFLWDVPPLPAAPGQWPFPRYQEPSYLDGSITRNPRDGLVTIIAYTRGEMFFDDNNDNGVWDPGERFIDQGEPFVDANDNGVWDMGELYFDANGNHQYDGPAGVYSADTYVWTETRILYTGRPWGDSAHSYIVPMPFAGPCPNGVPRGGVVIADAHFGDLNLNAPQSSGTSFTVGQPPKGSASITPGIQDGYGFQMERLLLDSSSLQACDPHSSTICVWKVLFGAWGAGYVGPLTINGAPVTDTNPCVNVSLPMSATVLNATLTVYVPGSIQ